MPWCFAQTTSAAVSQEYYFTSPPVTGPQSSVKVGRTLATASDERFLLSGFCCNQLWEGGFTDLPSCGQVILAADMSVASDDGAILFGKTDNPLNTARGIAEEVANNGYTLTLMNGDLSYAE